MRKPEAATISNPASLPSNRETISASITAGGFADLMVDWDLDELSILAMELKRGEIIAEIVDSEQSQIIEAIERLGWGDRLVRELEEANP